MNSTTSIKNRDTQVQEYINKVFNKIKQRDPNQAEFHQAVYTIFKSITEVLKKNPIYMEQNILERITEPERLISFRVPWVDDNGNVHVNRGYRVQFNSALGPYKGGLRFHPSVNESIIKFLGFEQIFKNALTGQSIGGGKGGADFDPKGKSDGEIMRFCQSYMNELVRYIGPDTDVPAGDIGVGAREIGYLFGQYKKIKGNFEAGVLTGKGLSYGGSLARKEATGYGVIYFVREMLNDYGDNLEGKRVIISGSGNVSIYAMEKAIELGAKVIACSDSNGYIYEENGIDLETIKRIKEVEQNSIEDYLQEHPLATYADDSSQIWNIPCDIALPCATQNELNGDAANNLIKNGVQLIAEGANMPSTTDAIEAFLANNILFGPAKAVNAGGVAVSSLEMAQNSSRTAWSFEEVDSQLQKIMKKIYHDSIQACGDENTKSNNLLKGATIAGFTRVADAMIAQGIT
ncbi:NADP-specific glutamate dehydrogenase [Ornithinibacillus halophilus]|uniref:Glutamate dehydrogenase n=1 Tax=Ornithinibacillus halophilus TaxID=930117 RepID=A0A1M5G989_9BACI|nr:NADP-specific glutamate dehydrogenase [Ornithinibacillus halophilus]SHG00315.1 glutamate dehydrogenase (NADP) [Ornithinibacillus halophilus]